MSSGSLDMLALAGSALAQGTGPAVPWARLVLAFLFCIGVAVCAIAVIRRRSGHGALPANWLAAVRGAHPPQRQLELLERLALSPTSQLILVRCGERRLTILTSPAGAHVVGDPEPTTTADATTPSLEGVGE